MAKLNKETVLNDIAKQIKLLDEDNLSVKILKKQARENLVHTLNNHGYLINNEYEIFKPK